MSLLEQSVKELVHDLLSLFLVMETEGLQVADLTATGW